MTRGARSSKTDTLEITSVESVPEVDRDSPECSFGTHAVIDLLSRVQVDTCDRELY
ncbi:MAG: hypothetical protein VYE68_11955 [Acidobacteriota bacterium]|nr:hypothetical protein [Acidobacteriota bacterium]